MKFCYNQKTDSLYIYLAEKPNTDSKVISGGIVPVYDADSNPAGLERRW
jgi:uncharacterized protein YuzE